MVQYSLQHQHHHRRISQLNKIRLAFLSVVLLALGWAVLSHLQRSADKTAPVATPFRSRTQLPNNQIFTTPYFQFQSTQDWSEETKRSSGDTYTYVATRNTLIQQDLTIYVNPKFSSPETTRLLPVSPRPDGTLVSQGPISEHCSTAAPKGYKDPFQMVFQRVTITCDTDGTIFIVLVGQQDGTGILTHKRPSGEAIRYLIIYRDLTAQPTGRDLAGIIRSFQTR